MRTSEATKAHKALRPGALVLMHVSQIQAAGSLGAGSSNGLWVGLDRRGVNQIVRGGILPNDQLPKMK